MPAIHTVAGHLSLLLLFTTFTLAQGINYSQLPACAQQCSLLTQANAACAAANPYLTCFCQSGYLTTLYQSPNGICTAFCTSSADNLAIQNWYISTCQAFTSATATAPVAAATTAAATAASTGAVTPSLSTYFPSATSSTAPQSWWSLHYKWIIMVIVLVLAFGIIICVGVFLKRRYMRKRNSAGNPSGAGSWAPNQPATTTTATTAQSAYYGRETRKAGKGKNKGKGRAMQPDMEENRMAQESDPGKKNWLKRTFRS